MLAPICQKTASSVSAGCFGSRSYTDKDVHQVEFTILDSHVSNGVWVGLTETPLGTSPPLYEYTSKSVAWTFSKKHNSAVERLFLKDPNLMSLDLIKGISASNLLIAPESLFNAAFSSFVLNDDHSSAVGYLNHPDAFFADFFNIGEDATVTLGNQQIKKNCKDNFAGSTTTTNFFACMYMEGRYPFRFYDVQRKTVRRATETDRWEKAFERTGFMIVKPNFLDVGPENPSNTRKERKEYQRGVTQAAREKQTLENLNKGYDAASSPPRFFKGPGQYVDLDCNFDTGESNDNRYPDAANVFPCTVLGYNYQKLVSRMFSAVGMLFIEGQNVAKYFNPFFVPVRESDDSCNFFDSAADITKTYYSYRRIVRDKLRTVSARHYPRRKRNYRRQDAHVAVVRKWQPKYVVVSKRNHCSRAVLDSARVERQDLLVDHPHHSANVRSTEERQTKSKISNVGRFRRVNFPRATLDWRFVLRPWGLRRSSHWP